MGLLGGKKQKPAAQQPQQPSTLPMVEQGMMSLKDIIAPSSVEVDFRFIRVGQTYYRTFFVVGYPRYVSPSWLAPLIDFDHELDIAMYAYPTSSNDILSDLRRKIAEMQATIASESEQGKVVDPKVTAALEDALGLQEELAKGVERFFQFGLYITLAAQSLPDLEETSKRLVTTLSSLLVLAKVATLQMEEGFKTTLPLAQDRLFIPRNMDTTSLASTFPFTSATLTQDKGVMYGINEQNGSLIVFDRYSLENANEVVLGKSGAGKSYLIKLEAMRHFMFGTEVIIIDPESEYENLARTLGGEVVEFSSNSPIKINPFDLSGIYEEGENELGLKILSLHGLLRIILGDLDAAHDAILDRALVETYKQKGITPDPTTQKNEPPLLEDLYKVLLGTEDPAAKDLALRLEKFVRGSVAGIFNQQSNFDLKNPLTVFSIRNLEEELRPVAMHIILDFVWTKVRKSLKKRLLILDEAWYMMKYEDSASFVYSIAKRARKYYLGLTTATQDVEDFMSTDYGKAVLSNSSIQMLLKQGTAEVDLIAKTFYLSEGEKELLLSADIGEGLFFAGQNHVAIKVIAAPFEHELITSKPQDVMKQQKQSAPTTLQAPMFVTEQLPQQPFGQPVSPFQQPAQPAAPMADPFQTPMAGPQPSTPQPMSDPFQATPQPMTAVPTAPQQPYAATPPSQQSSPMTANNAPATGGYTQSPAPAPVPGQPPQPQSSPAYQAPTFQQPAPYAQPQQPAVQPPPAPPPPVQPAPPAYTGMQAPATQPPPANPGVASFGAPPLQKQP